MLRRSKQRMTKGEVLRLHEAIRDGKVLVCFSLH
jgi:hypothetical protein